jgi:hypothetical protein
MSKSNEKDSSMQEKVGSVAGAVGGAVIGGEIGKVVGKAAIPIPFVGEAVGEIAGKVAGAAVGSNIGGAIGKSTVEQDTKVTRKDLNSLEAYYASPEYKKANPDKSPQDVKDRVQGVVNSKAEHINRVRKDTGNPNLGVLAVNKDQPSAQITMSYEQVKDMNAAKEWQKEVDKQKANNPDKEASKAMGI